ncbi:DUF4279 domain-containing protein [Peribacillus sp. SCS-37]|uniref:DUF4279 domain-containing protein n=1 Tax=Paraperibacillus esterisolvens TaxID=3115296 RepID=UPI00390649BE
MEKTQVSAAFILIGEDFPIDDVTERLGLKPSVSYRRGDRIPNRSSVRFRKETCWALETGYEASLDVNIQLHTIINQIQGKADLIKAIKAEYSLDCKFEIVIIIEDGDTPAFYLDKEILAFAAGIGTELDVDLYANPYRADLE